MLRLENLLDAFNFQRLIYSKPLQSIAEIDPTAVLYEQQIVPRTEEIIFVPIKPIISRTTLPSHQTPDI